jgi:hypothetical protein
MAGLIPPPPVTSSLEISSNSTESLLPPFLHLNSCITYEQDGQYHKGFLGQRDGIYHFVFKSHVNKRREDWGVDLRNLPIDLVDLCVEGILVPGHVSHSYLHPPVSLLSSTYDPVASLVSAVDLHNDCRPILIRALADTHPDRKIWLQSYYKEKWGVKSLGTFCKITLGEYRTLHKKGAQKAIPTMCVLTIKKDENLLPL